MSHVPVLLKRRAVIAGLAALLPAPTLARGMYCTRHRDRCEERRERWTNMTDEQRRAENDRFNQFLDGAAAKRKNDLVAGLGIIGLVAAALGGGAWLAVRSLKI